MKILIIQTAYIGDVVLITPIIEKIRKESPEAVVDVLVRSGCEELFDAHPLVHEVLIWKKDREKWKNLFRILRVVRWNAYNEVIGVQRFLSTSLLVTFSNANRRVGFRNLPWSWFWSYSIKYELKAGKHEVDRNLQLIGEDVRVLPKLYVGHRKNAVKKYQDLPYITLAPASVWRTKQLPLETWIAFVKQLEFEGNIYLLGSGRDHSLAEEIRESSGLTNIINLCGSLSLLTSAALMADAQMNYANDSAPLHLASAVNAPICAIFCSTVPKFGFGPLSERQHVVQIKEPLSCRPCGLHGYNKCPEGHFNCGNQIHVEQLLETLP